MNLLKRIKSVDARRSAAIKRFDQVTMVMDKQQMLQGREIAHSVFDELQAARLAFDELVVEAAKEAAHMGLDVGSLKQGCNRTPCVCRNRSCGQSFLCEQTLRNPNQYDELTYKVFRWLEKHVQ